MSRNVVFGIFTSGLFAYILLRSVMLSFTVDEAITYKYVSGFWEERLHSNHHFLNTWLMKAFSLIFGSHEWSLRLPNVLSFLLYAESVRRLLKGIHSHVIFFAGVALFLFNPLILEYFSLARGYGLSLAFGLFSFALLTDAFGRSRSDAKRSELLVGSALSAGVSLMANLNAINPALVIFGLSFTDQWITAVRLGNSKNRIRLLIIGLLSLLFTLFGVLVLQGLREGADLNLGVGSYSIALIRTINKLIYFPGVTASSIELLLGLAALIFVAVIGRWTIKSKIGYKHLPALVVLSGMTLGWIVEHEFFGTQLPQGRQLLIYFPILVFVILKAADQQRNYIGPVLTGVFGLAAVINFVYATNITHTRQWTEDAGVRSAMMHLAEVVRLKEPVQTIETDVRFRHVVWYYIHSRELPLELPDTPEVSGTGDYILVHPGTCTHCPGDRLLAVGYREIGSYANRTAILYSRR